MSGPKGALSLLVFGLGLAVGAVTAAAADAPRPVITVTTTPTDPHKYGWLSDDAQKGLAQAISDYKKGTLSAFVFAGAPGGSYWSYRSTSGLKDVTSIEDLARRALQACEFFTLTPCFIVSVNGYDALDAEGSLPIQPAMLADQPAEFDVSRVPFVPASDWASLQDYGHQEKAHALVITVDGSWWWAIGDDAQSALTDATADCKKADKDNTCVLYAINNHVVFAVGDPH